MNRETRTKQSQSLEMHNNILQHFRHSLLSPSYQKNWSPFQEKSSIGQSLSHYNMASEASTDKENMSNSALNLANALPVSQSSSRDDMVKEDAEFIATREEDYYSKCMPYTAYNFMTYRQRGQLDNGRFNESTKSEATHDFENESHEHLRTGDIPSSTDTSLSTNESTSPKSTGSPSSSNRSICSTSGSEKSSPSSAEEAVSSPDSESKQSKKLERTSYTNEQLQTLLKIFHENPYPDSEMMETISLDLGVPESKIKIWFQNKRARWRKRVNNGPITFPQHFMPMSPMLSPVGHYGFMPQGQQMMTSSPSPMMLPGYFNYASMHTSPYPSSASNSAASRIPHTYPPMGTTTTHQFSRMAHQQAITSMLQNSLRTSPPDSTMTSQNGRSFQY